MSETIKVVSQHDAAIDKKKSRLDEYRKTANAQHIAFLDGKAPVWFTLRELTLQDVLEIQSLPSVPTQAARAFRLALVAIDGAPKLGEGSWRPIHQHERGPGDTINVASWADMEAIFRAVGVARIYDIGGYAIERAGLVGNGDGGVG